MRRRGWKGKSLRRLVLEALDSVQSNLPLTNEYLAGFVARKLGGQYVKTREGWERVVEMERERLV